MFYLKIEMVISVGISTNTLRSGHVVIIIVFFFETFSILFIPTAFQISESRPGLDLFLLPHVPDQPLLFFFFVAKKKDVRIVVPFDCSKFLNQTMLL